MLRVDLLQINLFDWQLRYTKKKKRKRQKEKKKMYLGQD